MAMSAPSTSAASQSQALWSASSSLQTPAGTSQQSLTGLTRDLVNNFRFQLAVTVMGQKVFVEVFLWTYQGGPSVPIKEYLFKTLKFSEKKYKSLFNVQQRTTINSGTDCTTFDISLLYILLQNVCGLADLNDPVWKSGGQQTLEYLINKVKSLRNEIAHTSDIQPMSDQELIQKLSNLENILSDILSFAGTRSGKDSVVVSNMVTEIHNYFQELQLKLREPFDLMDTAQLPHLQQEMALFLGELKSSVQRDSENELCSSYPGEFELELVHWLLPDIKVRPSLMFTKMVIEEDISLARPSLRLQPQEIKYEDLLQAKDRDGLVHDVLIVSGEGGVGKSTFLKYLVEKWVEEIQARVTGNQGQVTEVQGLHHISPLLFFQLRETTVSTWEDMLDRRLSNSISNSKLSTKDFGKLINQMNTVVLLDGFDEAHEMSVDLVRELFDIPNNRIVVTTRPDFLDTLTRLVPARRRRMNVKILGIREEYRLPFIEKTLGVLLPDLNRRNEALKKLETKLGSPAIDREVITPLNLELLVILEVECPDLVTFDSSTSTVYQEMINLIKGKVENRRKLLGISDCQQKIAEYMEFHEEVALHTVIRNEQDLSAKTVKELERKCLDLQLPYSEILSGFFTMRRTWQGLTLRKIWSYPHGRFQEQWAANNVVKQLLAFPQSDIPDELNHSVADNPLMKIFTHTGEIFPSDLLHTEKIQNLLVVVTGLLAESHEQLLKSLAPSIISLVRLNTQACVDNVLIHVLESKGNATILQQCATRLIGYKDWVTFGRCFNILPTLLLHIVPETLYLAIESPKDCQLDALKAVSERNIDVYLMSLKKRPNEYWDQHLEILANSSNQCNFTKAICCLSATGVMQLPRNIEDLEISADIDAIHVLASRLSSFNELQFLSLTIQHPSQSTPGPFPSLPVTEEILNLTLHHHLFLATPEIEWWCDAVAQLWYQARVVRRSVLNTYLEADGDLKTLLNGLHQRNVYADLVQVYAYRSTLSEEERREVKQMVQSLGFCESFSLVNLLKRGN